MMKLNVYQSHPLKNIPHLSNPVHGHARAALPLTNSGPFFRKTHKASFVAVASNVAHHEAEITDIVAYKKDIIRVKAVVKVKKTILAPFLAYIGLHDVQNMFGKTLLLELVSSELDPRTGLEKSTITIRAYAQRRAGKGEDEYINYETEFEVPLDFGEVGAVFVENEHAKEIFVEEIVFHGFPRGPATVSCSSWIHSKNDNTRKRVFFANKSCLPSETPDGLKRLRDEELVHLRGNGHGERQFHDRIYDYDVYNDLGDPDVDTKHQRPILGGKDNPYPRRCKTGRPRCTKDPMSETRAGGQFYVPRDERFSETKRLSFWGKTMSSLMPCLIPTMETTVTDQPDLEFPCFTAIDLLFCEGIKLPQLNPEWILQSLVSGDMLRFPIPETMKRDKFFWSRDEEFARQTLAGLNPCSIQLVSEWPLISNLDPAIYGPKESAITTEMIEREIGGFMTINEAVQQKKLFIVDYHDMFLPLVGRVRELEGTTLYGSRTLFFLNADGTLRPLAIELTRPPIDGKPQWKQAFTPSGDSTACWLWRLAKAHVLAHDAGYHQLVSHWLRSHCATEPYIIATNRHLSVMHPVYSLLHPHFRYTLEINALAREELVNADGIIESSFTPGKYSMELSSVAYDLHWRFDHEALPADLINRGMAVEDQTAPHGLRLAIEDYPFANGGLLLWDAIKEWVTDYVNHYYPNAALVESDQELQSWWNEIRTVGHGDKKDEPWWPVLNSPQNLIHILSTMIWVTSGHHAAVNFGQYAYGGYFPNRPTIARTKMPTEDPTDEEWKFFLRKPEAVLLRCFPSRLQAMRVMAVLDVLSNHSPDEEYLGERMEPAWRGSSVIEAAFERFNERLKEIERVIGERNADVSLKNRTGAGIMPYELLKPFSEPGVTGVGVPNSISV